MTFWPGGRPFFWFCVLCLYRIYQEFCIIHELAMGLLNRLLDFVVVSTFRSYNSVPFIYSACF